MPSHLHLAHRRTARIAARGRVIKTDDTLEKTRKKCKKDFAAFCEYVSEGKKKPAAHHREWISYLVTEEDTNCLHRIGGKDQVILSPRGPLHPDTRVATPNGWTALRLIAPGDTVYGGNGQPTQVTGTVVYPDATLYRVIYSDGTSMRCDDSHRFAVRTTKTASDEFQITTLQALRTRLKSVSWDQVERHQDRPWLDPDGQPLFEVPVAQAVQYPAVDLPVEPRHTTLFPAIYAQGSVQERTELLQALMDVYGEVSPTQGLVASAVDQRVIQTVVDLVRSLGGLAMENTRPEDLSAKGNVLHYAQLQLPHDLPPFTTAAKQEQYEELLMIGCVSSASLQRWIVDIEPAGQSPVMCLSVANEAQQFLIEDYVVSMNSAKSTLTGLFTAWAIGIHADEKIPLKILYISYTVDVARPKSAAIKNVVSSKRYQDIFPNVAIKKGMTSNEYWSIDYKLAGIEETGDEQFTVCCAGLKGSITSKRSSLVIIDDCIKAANDIKNPEVRREMQENWNSVIAPTMFEGARAICLGTRFRHDDIFATTFIPRNGWNQVVQQALVTDDYGNMHSYWPEMWSLDYLMKKKTTAPISFSFQYMNQIVRQSELSLSPDLLIRSEIATEFDSIGVGVDLSSGTKDRNDYTVMTLGGRIGDKIHIIDYRRFRVMGNLEKLDKMMELLADWNLLVPDTEKENNYFPTFSVCDIWSEAVQYQASLEADFKRICIGEMGLHNLKWHAVKGFKSDKLARFRGIMGLFEQRKIVFNRYRGFMNMFDELTNFGTSGHDDCVDSLVYLVNGLMRRGSLEVDY